MEDRIIKVEDEKELLLLESIPVWITKHGYITLIIIFISLLIGSMLIEYPQKTSINIDIDSTKAIAVFNFNTFDLIKDQDTVHIENPFEQKDFAGILEKDKAYANGRDIYVPVLISDEDRNRLNIKNHIICSGVVVIKESSILSVIINKK